MEGIHTYLPWSIIVLGSSMSILLAAIIRYSTIARQHRKALSKEIGHRITAEESREKLENALLQGQKLQAMGTLAGGIAHDFNNILYAIIGYVEMARDDVEKDSLVHKNLGKVLEAAHRGQDLVSRILSFSRKHHHEFENLHLNSTIEAVLKLLRSTIPTSVMIIYEAEADVYVHGNQTQLHQVLINIINNAVDAMDGEGTIHIRLLKDSAGPFQQSYCKIKIKDTGQGMDQQTMDRIFEPFYTTKEVGKGTGLGLSIVHTIIEEHHGKVLVTSELGKGTEFTILLPQIPA